jgi:flagellar protein FliS
MAQDHYLFTEVKTAPPQKLQLLLIEGALRLANRTRQFWQQGHNDRATESLVRAQEIVGQMLAGINHKVGGDLARRVSSLYEFILRCLANAVSRHDDKGLGDAIRILEIERETWRQLCDRLAVNAPHANFGDAPRGVLPIQSSDADLLSQSGGFSTEA